MPAEIYIVIAAMFLGTCLVGAVLMIMRRRGTRSSRARCSHCGQRLPRGTSHCPVCDVRQADGRRPSPSRDIAPDEPLGEVHPAQGMLGCATSEPPKPSFEGRPLPDDVQRMHGLSSVREPAYPAGDVRATTAKLIAIQGPLAHQRFTIPPQGLAIGRHPDNDIVLANELMVSRYHAVITLEADRYVLYDRDSANGTWVNEERIFRHVLTPGDQIALWNSLFVFGTSDTPLPPPPPQPIASQPTIQVKGEYFCGYYLESLIGRGGMSEVFRARDVQGATVAIKILHERDPYLVEKFVQEGNQIGPLLRGHTNIVDVHEFGASPDGRLYIVMEYVAAPSLRKMLRGPLSEIETVRIMGQVCCALAFAHENEVVHRDIKPENILVTTDGVAKVLDFGIAKLTSASTVTRDKIVGTPEYISPEQVRGDPVRPASDVYSMGIVLYELLTGSVPFRRPNTDSPQQAAFAVIRQHLEESPEPVRKRNPNAQISPQLEWATMRALNKDLRDRYPTARELGDALGCQPSALGLASDHALKPTPASLVILQGPRRGEGFDLSDQPLVLGRFELGSSNTMISRQHITISCRGGSYWLEDRSKNGTWVNNLRVYGEVPLTWGAIVRIGDNVLRLEQTGAGM